MDRHGRPSGQLIDSRGETRPPTVNLDSRYHFLRHLMLELHRESPTTRRSGAFASAPLDLRRLLTPGTPVTVGVHHAGSEPTTMQDLIEYALMPAVMP